MRPAAASGAPSSGGARRFRFRPWLGLLTLVSLVVLLGLGTWQVRRLVWKEDLIARAEAQLAAPAARELQADAGPDAVDYRRFTLAGRYRHDAAVAFGVSAVDGEPGARLVTPLVLEDGRAILVDRGWLPERLLPPAVPAGLEPAGRVEVEGVARWRGGDVGRPWVTPADQPGRRRFFAWDLAAIGGLAGLELEPVVLTLDRSGGDLPRAMPLEAAFTNNHLGYAITWYGLAAGLVAVYLTFSLGRAREDAR